MLWFSVSSGLYPIFQLMSYVQQPLDRQVTEKDEFGASKPKNKCAITFALVSIFYNWEYRPFIIDLESTNSTYVNDEAVPTSRFYELKAGDGGYFPFHMSILIHLQNLLQSSNLDCQIGNMSFCMTMQHEVPMPGNAISGSTQNVESWYFGLHIS